MNEERRRILTMLSEGKISPTEAEQLLDAVHAPAATETQTAPVAPKYLRVLVEDPDGTHGGKVNVRVPFDLIRAGVRIAALLPATVHGPVNKALREQGIDIDVSKIKADDLESLVQHLRDLQVDVEGGAGEKVRVFCE